MEISKIPCVWVYMILMNSIELTCSVNLLLQDCPAAIDELEQLTLETYRDGTSLVALQGDRVVGVAFNKVQSKPGPGEVGFFDDFKDNKCKTETAKEYIYLMMRVMSAISHNSKMLSFSE